MITFLENFILGITLTLPLGPVTLEILKRGLRSGYIQAALTGLGSFTAELVFFAIMYFGLAEFSESIIVKYVLGTLGVLFLLYLGYINIKDFFNNKKDLENKSFRKSSFIAGFLITFLNPLNFFMWAGIIGGSIAQNKSFLVNLGIMLGIFVSYVIISGLTIFGKKIIKDNVLKYVSLAAGLFLVFYALKLAYEIFL